VLVHGGGPEITDMLKKMGKESQFINGLRYTDAETAEVVQMVLTGKINKDIVSQLNAMGGKAVGLCGKDANLIRVTKRQAKDGVDLGYVGDVVEINTKFLKMLAQEEYIPVIAPVGADDQGNSYNINADTVAGEIAAAIHAEKLIFLTDIDGIRADKNEAASLISAISVDEIHAMIDSGAIEGGMIPKVQGCIKGIQSGVNRTHILNGTIAHPLILEIFTDKGVGTMVYSEKEKQA